MQLDITPWLVLAQTPTLSVGDRSFKNFTIIVLLFGIFIHRAFH